MEQNQISAGDELGGTGTNVLEQTTELPIGQLQACVNPLDMLISDSEEESFDTLSDDEMKKDDNSEIKSQKSSIITQIEAFQNNNDSSSMNLSQLKKEEDMDSSILEGINNLNDRELQNFSIVKDTDLSNILFNYDENLEKQLLYNLQSDSKKALMKMEMQAPQQ